MIKNPLSTLNENLTQYYPLLTDKLDHFYRLDETKAVEALLEIPLFSSAEQTAIQQDAFKRTQTIRQSRLKKIGFDAFLKIFGNLSSKRGVLMMCLAEALLRIPDSTTQTRLIKDKLKIPFGLAFLMRPFVLIALKGLGQHFVIGQTIESALKRAQSKEKQGYSFSYDMLGEAAKTERDALHYFNAYLDAITAISKQYPNTDPLTGPGISVKLSALYPRYEWVKQSSVLAVLLPRLKTLALSAQKANIGLTIDAEESERLELSLMLVEQLIQDPQLQHWQGLGLAVQAYQKRAMVLIEQLIDVARTQKRFLTIRLVKGAYWDSEIKQAQERGFSNYAVFTRKSSTDLSYMVCAKKLLGARDCVYPQFATHNAYTVSAVLKLAGDNQSGFEFQCLQGMGDVLYQQMVKQPLFKKRCRVYAPVGHHTDLLSYLVRRLLENGANSSFVNQILDTRLSIEDLVEGPVQKIESLFKKQEIPHPKIPLPLAIYGIHRPGAKGLDLTHRLEIYPMLNAIESLKPMVLKTLNQPLTHIDEAGLKDVVVKANTAFKTFNTVDIETRALYLKNMAGLLEENRVLLMTLLILEGGKTILDAASELKEAIDFCWYYREQLLQQFNPIVFKGPTGEENKMYLSGRGIMLCISPWNFPLAIFLGQIVAALAAGNVVVAKPALQTPHIALTAVTLLEKAGFAQGIVQCVIGRGQVVGDLLVKESSVSGVLFTGSTQTACHINQQLALRKGPIIPFIAETGGQNCMIADTSALPETLVSDIILSAFNSAGQRCSALRVLFLPEQIKDRVLTMLIGAMEMLTIGDPSQSDTDIGPVIDKSAEENLLRHVERMASLEKEQKTVQLLYQCALPNGLPSLTRGVFFAPRLYQISNLKLLTEEVFGPILHVITYDGTDRKSLDTVIDAIHHTGYGLTLGIHSRIQETVDYITERVSVGNIYVNRNMIGAVVGVQPFGGEGLSGTGPKAGGPHMLQRLAVERTLSINTTASGGNVALMTLTE